jgi:hypothetical protein
MLGSFAIAIGDSEASRLPSAKQRPLPRSGIARALILRVSPRADFDGGGFDGALRLHVCPGQ